ncbi:DNA-binding response regulator [Micromonospora sp. NPDC048830]|uniref:DNA-binding response regulator n=1 Tax=Micromonospora sp. NPDC048830 TaxID=3364257 RepID=UPI003714464F
MISTDVISRAGVIGQLWPRPEVLLIDDSEADRAQATLVIGGSVDESTVRTLRTLRIRKAPAPGMVVTHVDDAGLVAAVEHGVVGIVRRSEASPERLVAVIRAAVGGDGSLPPDLLGRLRQQVGVLQRDFLGPRGLPFAGLADREAQVLRLIADGYDTAEIAGNLSYPPDDQVHRPRRHQPVSAAQPLPCRGVRPLQRPHLMARGRQDAHDRGHSSHPGWA